MPCLPTNLNRQCPYFQASETLEEILHWENRAADKYGVRTVVDGKAVIVYHKAEKKDVRDAGVPLLVCVLCSVIEGEKARGNRVDVSNARMIYTESFATVQKVSRSIQALDSKAIELNKIRTKLQEQTLKVDGALKGTGGPPGSPTCTAGELAWCVMTYFFEKLRTCDPIANKRSATNLYRLWNNHYWASQPDADILSREWFGAVMAWLQSDQRVPYLKLLRTQMYQMEGDSPAQHAVLRKVFRTAARCVAITERTSLEEFHQAAHLAELVGHALFNDVVDPEVDASPTGLMQEMKTGPMMQSLSSAHRGSFSEEDEATEDDATEGGEKRRASKTDVCTWGGSSTQQAQEARRHFFIVAAVSYEAIFHAGVLEKEQKTQVSFPSRQPTELEMHPSETAPSPTEPSQKTPPSSRSNSVSAAEAAGSASSSQQPSNHSASPPQQLISSDTERGNRFSPLGISGATVVITGSGVKEKEDVKSEEAGGGGNSTPSQIGWAHDDQLRKVPSNPPSQAEGFTPFFPNSDESTSGERSSGRDFRVKQMDAKDQRNTPSSSNPASPLETTRADAAQNVLDALRQQAVQPHARHDKAHTEVALSAETALTIQHTAAIAMETASVQKKLQKKLRSLTKDHEDSITQFALIHRTLKEDKGDKKLSERDMILLKKDMEEMKIQLRVALAQIGEQHQSHLAQQKQSQDQHQNFLLHQQKQLAPPAAPAPAPTPTPLPPPPQTVPMSVMNQLMDLEATLQATQRENRHLTDSVSMLKLEAKRREEEAQREVHSLKKELDSFRRAATEALTGMREEVAVIATSHQAVSESGLENAYLREELSRVKQEGSTTREQLSDALRAIARLERHVSAQEQANIGRHGGVKDRGLSSTTRERTTHTDAFSSRNASPPGSIAMSAPLLRFDAPSLYKPKLLA